MIENLIALEPGTKILSRTPVVTATLSLDALNGALKDDMPPMD